MPWFIKVHSECDHCKVKACHLSLYGEPKKDQYEVIPEQISSLRQNVSSVRKATWRYMDGMQGTVDRVKLFYNTGKEHSVETVRYVQNDTGVLQRAAIITVAGLGGIVAGYRGRYLRKAIFAGMGMVAAASICYPEQAVDITSRSWLQTKQEVVKAWNKQFPGKGDSDASLTERLRFKIFGGTSNSSKLVTGSEQTQKAEEPKMDFGQSSEEHKDMYSTRES